MSERIRISWTTTLALLVTVSAVTAFVLTGCGQSKAPQAATAAKSTVQSAVDAVAEAEAAYEDKVSRIEDQVADMDEPVDRGATLILDNQTGMDVLVKIVGEGGRSYAVNVPSQTKAEKHCREGRFFLKMRYKTATGYNFQKGDEFTLSSEGTTTITLHKVVAGNYGSTALNPKEF